MQLERVPHFDRAMARLEAWWDCQILDRPPVHIQIRPEREPARPVPAKTHATLRERWLDYEYALDRLEAGLDHAVWLGETFPTYMPNVGPEVCAAAFGCELEFSENSSWSVPRAANCREILDIPMNLDGPYWANIRSATATSLQRGAGRWITAVTDLHTNGDLLAALRDPQNLCTDLIDDLASVRAACDYVTNQFPRMFDDLWQPIQAAGQPCTSWIPFLHAARASAMQCDFICMISPAMFRATILPSLIRESQFLDRSIYHLDGPGALRHLDDLLGIPTLDGIQWVRGAGNGPASQWVQVYQRIQAGGKCLQLLADDLDDARATAEHLRPEGVWLCPAGSYTRDEAENFLRWAAAWAAGKRA